MVVIFLYNYFKKLFLFQASKVFSLFFNFENLKFVFFIFRALINLKKYFFTFDVR